MFFLCTEESSADLEGLTFHFILFIAPEMLKGDVVGPPADIWSLGVVTFIM